MVLGLVLEVFELREFAGPDSLGYDLWANQVVDFWLGLNLGPTETRGNL